MALPCHLQGVYKSLRHSAREHVLCDTYVVVLSHGLLLYFAQWSEKKCLCELPAMHVQLEWHYMKLCQKCINDLITDMLSKTFFREVLSLEISIGFAREESFQVLHVA